MNMEIATTLLSEAGAVITPVSNGEAAVEAFSQNPQGTFDVILMDIMMPVMDGLTAARTIRGMQRADAASIPIIAMTQMPLMRICRLQKRPEWTRIWQSL